VQGLDGAQLHRVAEQYRLGAATFRVLTGISRTSRWPELSADRVRETLRVCREEADVVLVDVGFNLEADEEIVTDLFAPRRNAATLTALAEADVVVAVGAADPVGLARFLRGHAELIQLVPADRVHGVVTRVRSSAVGASPSSQIASALLRFGGIVEATLVPSDSAAFDAALLTARTLQEAAPRSPALAALRELADGVLPPAPAPIRSRARRRFLGPAPV
jgi:Flp pilus assembly CpaE family ATPase